MSRSGPESGKRNLWRAAWRRIAEVTTADVLERDVAKPVRDYQASPRVRIAAFDATGGWRETIPHASWKSTERSLRRGDYGWYATVDEQFAGWLWMSEVSHRDPWSGITMRLKPDETYSYGLKAVPEFRSDGVAAVLFANALRHLQAQAGMRVVYGWVDVDNRPSQLLLRMLFGFTQVQQVKYARLLGKWGFQVPRSARPVSGPAGRR